MESGTPLNDDDSVETGLILHVVVVGFHHKKGCQVEYAYPPFEEGEPAENPECPEKWKHLPSLALPDGAHNFEKDTIFFHMPSRCDPTKTVFGISCYRQMNAESLINRSADVTRDTVQKSVCILSTLPLYGLINAKLELITHAYFDERDFSKVSLLEETFTSLNSSLKDDIMQGQQVFLGLSTRDLVLQFGHKVVLLVKLILLEKKVLFLKGPVKDLCTLILSLLSLFPGMIEHGLENCMKLGEVKDSFEILPAISEMEDMQFPLLTKSDAEIKSSLDAIMPEVILKEENQVEPKVKPSQENGFNPTIDPVTISITEPNVSSGFSETSIERKPSDIKHTSKTDKPDFEIGELCDCESQEKVDYTKSKLEFRDKDNDGLECDALERNPESIKGSKTSLASRESVESLSRVTSIKGRVMGAFSSYWGTKDKPNGEVESEDALHEDNSFVDVSDSDFGSEKNGNGSIGIGDVEEKFTPWPDVTNLDINKCGLPLDIFNEGMLCHPYLSLPFLDLLKKTSVRGFVAGATNVLFKQKRHLVDVIIEIDDGKIDILDNDLRKQLHLTTEDLRFADYIVKNVSSDKEDVFLDGTGWEGGDEWLRAQFKLYFLCLLRTSMLQEGSRELEAFNPLFMSTWQSTRNYSVWKESDHWSVLEINPGHPFQGQLSMSDMRLRISHTMQNSERGRKINQAVVNTGKAVAQTSKALGGAINQAKTAVSSWLQMFNNSTPQPEPVQE